MGNRLGQQSNRNCCLSLVQSASEVQKSKVTTSQIIHNSSTIHPVAHCQETLAMCLVAGPILPFASTSPLSSLTLSPTTGVYRGRTIQIYADHRKHGSHVRPLFTSAQNSFQFFAHCRAVYTAIPLVPKATFTPVNQLNLCLPRTHVPFSSP